MEFTLEAVEEKFNVAKDEDGNLEISDKMLKRFVKKNYQVIEKVAQIGLPRPGEQLRLITVKAFNTISIVKYIADQEIIRSAKFVIFAINRYAAQVLIDLKKQRKLNNTILIISSLRNAGIKDKSIAIEMLEKHFNILFIVSHAKIAILETEKGNYYNIEGSGNFSFNARLEQYIIDNDKGVYDFSEQWIKDIEKIK